MNDVLIRYSELFNIIFTFVVPVAKLAAIICGVLLIEDLRWIAHQIRKNASGYDK